MTTTKPPVHFVDNYLIAPTNPVTVSVIGAGGTGSQVVTALARMHQSLLQLDHPGLRISLIDDDEITLANTGRQLFADTEIGLLKSVALINRLNRFFGTNWKAVTEKITHRLPLSNWMGQLVISCVDSVSARFTIANRLQEQFTDLEYQQRPLYWMDFGNGQYTGQAILSTVQPIDQPRSRKFQPIGQLPMITAEYQQELKNKSEDRLPSCSLAEALRKQDLFINSTLANLGCSLLWNMFREGMIQHRGIFLNLKTMQTTGIPLH